MLISVSLSVLLGKAAGLPAPTEKSTRSVKSKILDAFDLDWMGQIDYYYPGTFHSDFGSLYDSYSILPTETIKSKTTTTTTTTSTTSSPAFEFKTLIDGGEIVNCLLDEIRCYEIIERRSTPTNEPAWSETTKYWEKTTEDTIHIDWVSF